MISNFQSRDAIVLPLAQLYSIPIVISFLARWYNTTWLFKNHAILFSTLACDFPGKNETRFANTWHMQSIMPQNQREQRMPSLDEIAPNKNSEK